MMSAVPNSPQKPERFDLYVRKFRATCVMHGIQAGSPADLSGFMQKLMEDRYFAMDFWKLIGKLSDREGGELSDDQMLAVIVDGVTGGEISEEDAEGKKTVDDLRAMLAGVDVQGPGQNQVEPAPFPRSEPDAWQGSGGAGIHAVESSQRLADSRAAFMAQTMNQETIPVAASPEPQLPQLDEGLLRLELTRLMEQYLESVRRTRTLVPEEDVPIGVVEDVTIHESLEAPASAEVEDELPLKPIGTPRLVLDPASPLVEDLLVTKSDNPLARVPLASYSPPTGHGRSILYLLPVLALFAAGFASYLYRAPLLRETTLLIQNIRQKTGTAASASQSASPTVVPGPEESASQPETSQQPGTTAPLLNAPTFPPQAASALSPTAEARKAIADRAALQAEPPPDLISSADLAGIVQVSPEAMETYLVVSRVPAYPDTAKTDGVEGSVVMQVIIAKDGTVKRVHVIRGDSRLRVAAAEAVYRWKYRPYLVDGEPVEVATTITVDFDLNR